MARWTWSLIWWRARCSTICCGSCDRRAATPRPARSPARSSNWTCARCISSTWSCTAPRKAPAPPSADWPATSRTVGSGPCWTAPSASPSSTKPSAPSWASPISASWSWSPTGTGTRSGHPMCPGTATRWGHPMCPGTATRWGHTMRRERSLDLIDTQAGGDVSRVVTAGIEPIPGTTALEKARYLQREGDGLRRLLLSEPYGDPAMSVDLIVEPGHPEAQAGYIIMEAMGYPMYSGSNTICVATALLQSGMVEMREGLQDVILESPAGLARVSARNIDGRVESITTQGEPAYVAERGLGSRCPRSAAW